MKLTYRIISRISLALLLIIAAWASLFYIIIIEEINDETDDSLEDYSEYIITHALAGEKLPDKDNGTNNSYHITEITPEYAAQNQAIRYHDEMIYIYSKQETEPARILKTIFKDAAGKYYELTVSIPSIEKADLREAILWWIILLYFALTILILGINWFILHRSFKPLYKLLNWLDNFSVEKKNTDPEIDTYTTEFRKLSDVVTQNARRNSEIYEQQKLFIGNASHELQTPLAIAINRLEMLADDTQLNEKQLEEVLKTKQVLEHAVRLNKTLLLLTRIENGQFHDKKEIIINEVIKKITTDYSEIFAERHISLSLQESAMAKIYMNEPLASVLFGNLLKNAFLHNIRDGEIHIEIKAKSIIIANTGRKEMLSKETIFDRFNKGNKNENSVGLGLALCKSVCKLYNINIEYDFLDEKHVFSLSF